MNAVTRLRRGVRYLGYTLGAVAVLLVAMSYWDDVLRTALADAAAPSTGADKGQQEGESASPDVSDLQHRESKRPNGDARRTTAESAKGQFDGHGEGLFSGATVYILPEGSVDELSGVEAKEAELAREGAGGPSSPQPLGSAEEVVPDEIASLLEAQAPEGEGDARSRMPEPIEQPPDAEVAGRQEAREVGQSRAFMRAFQALIGAQDLESLLVSGFAVRERDGGTTTLTHPSGVTADLERTLDSQAITLKASGRNGERDAIKLEVERFLRSFAGEPELYRGGRTWFFGEAAVTSTSGERAYEVSFARNELASVPIGVTNETPE